MKTLENPCSDHRTDNDFTRAPVESVRNAGRTGNWRSSVRALQAFRVDMLGTEVVDRGTSGESTTILCSQFEPTSEHRRLIFLNVLFTFFAYLCSGSLMLQTEIFAVLSTSMSWN